MKIINLYKRTIAEKMSQTQSQVFSVTEIWSPDTNYQTLVHYVETHSTTGMIENMITVCKAAPDDLSLWSQTVEEVEEVEIVTFVEGGRVVGQDNFYPMAFIAEYPPEKVEWRKNSSVIIEVD